MIYIIELLLDKTNKIACAPREDSAQPDQSLCCLHEESFGS